MGAVAYSVDVEGEDAFLATMRKLGEAAQKALASGDNQAFRAELERTSKAADETLRSLTPLAKATGEFERAWQGLSNALKTSAGSREQNLKGLRDLEAVMKSQLGTLSKNTAEHQALERVYKSVTAETGRYAAAQRSVAYPTADIAKYATSLKAITDAEKAGLASKKDTLTQLKSLQGAMAEYAGSLGKGTNELTALNKVMVSAGTATNKLESEQRKLEAAFRADYLRVYAGELKQIDAAVKSGTSGFGDAITKVNKLTAELQSQQSELGQTGKDYDTLGRLLQSAATQQERYQKAAQDAARANDAAEIRAYAGELDRLEVTLKDTTQALGQLDSQQRALKYDAQGVSAYRTQQEGLQNVLDTTGRSLGELQTRVRDYATSASLGARESAALEKVMRDTEGAATRLAQAQDKASQSFRTAELGRFATELKQIETAQKAGAISADQAATAVGRLQAEFRDYAAGLGVTQRELATFATNQREAGTSADTFAQGMERAGASTDGLAGDLNQVEGELTQLSGSLREVGQDADQGAAGTERLGGSVRELGSSLGNSSGDFDRLGGSIRELGSVSDLSAQDLRALSDVEQQLEGATIRLAAAQDKAANAFNSEFIRQQVAALNDLKLALEKGDISQEQFSAGAKQIGIALEQARSGLEQNTRSYAGYTGALTKVESSLARAEGRVRVFGASAGVTAGVSDQLQNVLYRLGPAGEAMGVAMFSAGAGMEGAAVGARALQVALAVGIVGAVVGAAVAAKTLFDTSKALDTAMVDVSKSTGFTRQEMLGLTNELQKVSLATGTPTKDLLELAAVAGQMGITGVDNVAAFTKSLDILTKTTDIIGEEGAQQMAQFINVTKEANVTTAESANLVTNTLVALGNSVAGGEARILAMAQRLGVLKSAAGLSQTDILGLAGGFVDLGLTAERAEISVTSTFTAISKAASAGGQSLQTFADASGLTADEFKRLADENPTDAFLALVGGLAKAKAEGQDLNPILDKLAAGNNTLRNVLLTLVGGYDKVSGAVNTAREESGRLTAAQDELANRLGVIEGIGSRVGSVFRLIRDELAIALIPAFRDGLNGILDFSRAIAGLEPDARAVGTFATQAGGAIRDFTIALFGLGSVTDSVGGQLGEKLSGALKTVNDAMQPVATALDTIQGAFSNAGVESNKFVLNLLGVETAASSGGRAGDDLATSLTGAGNASTFLASQVPEINDALNQLKPALEGSQAGMVAYRGELEALLQKYPEAEYAIRPAIDLLNQQIGASDGAAAATFDLAQAQSSYANLQKLALPQAQAYLDNLLALKKANPEAAASLDPLITGTQLYIKTLGDTAPVTEAAANSLEGLRAKRQELVEQYNRAEIGSAAQAEALAAIRAIDSQIEAADRLSASYEDTTDSVDIAIKGYAKVTEAIGILPNAYATVSQAVDISNKGWATVAAPIDIAVKGYANVAEAVGIMVTAYATVPDSVPIPIPDARPIVDFAAVVKVQLADAFTEASRQAEAFGNSNLLVQGKIEALRNAIQLLLSQGYDPQGTAVQNLVGRLQELEAGVQRQIDANKTYADNLKTVRDAQEAFNDGISANEIDGYIEGLRQAAEGTGELGAQARLTIEQLQGLKVAYQGLEALKTLASEIAKSFDTTAAQDSLEALKEKKLALLESGNYDGADFAALNADIAELESSIGRAQIFEGVFSAIAEGANALGAAIEDGASKGEQALAVLGGALEGLGEAFGEADSLAAIHLENMANGLTQLASGDFIGFVGTAIKSVVDVFSYASNESQRYQEAVAASGEEVANRFIEQTNSFNGRVTEFNEQAYQEYVSNLEAQEKATKERLEAIQKAWEEAQERIRAAQQELVNITREANQTLSDLNRETQDARIAFYESTNKGKGAEQQTFIAETILQFRAQSAEFNAEMQRITREKEEFIRQYMAANPGAGRAEANAAAERIFGPQRDALKEQFALTSATILNEAAQQAKDLGLSQSQFYEAVFAGNNEILGNMTEGQRQSIIQFVELARELGIELPKALEDAYGKVNETWVEAGQQSAEAQREASAAQAEAFKAEKEEFQSAWAERSAYLKEQIANSSGETKAMYEEMFRVESEAYTNGLRERNTAINNANAEANQMTVAEMEKQRETLKSEYEKSVANIDEALKTATGAEKAALEQRRAELTEAYRTSDQALADAINEGQDGVGSALADNAQATVNMLQDDIRTLNTAWANRSAELQNLIANSTGAAQEAYQRMYEQESSAYETARQNLQEDLVKANQDLLDAQDRGSADWVAAQEEIGRKEAEALGGIYEQLRAILGPDADLIISHDSEYLRQT